MNLIAHFIKGKRRPQYIVDDETLDALVGKFCAKVGDELYAPFDSATEAAAWAMERTKRK